MKLRNIKHYLTYPPKMAFIILGVFAILAIISFLQYDQNLYLYCRYLLDESIHKFAQKTTFLAKGEYWLVPSALILLVGIFVKNIRNFSINLFATLVLTSVIVFIIKNLVGRARPYTQESLGLAPNYFEFGNFLNPDFASFPSGHTITIFAVWAVIWFNIKQKIWGLMFLPLAIWLASTRFIIGSHHLSDVLFSVGLATFCALWVRESLK